MIAIDENKATCRLRRICFSIIDNIITNQKSNMKTIQSHQTWLNYLIGIVNLWFVTAFLKRIAPNQFANLSFNINTIRHQIKFPNNRETFYLLPFVFS